MFSPSIYKEVIFISKRKTHEQYIEELHKIHKYINPLEQYVGRDKNIQHECTICNYVWNPKPYTLLAGSGCPNCAMQEGRYHIKKTNEQYLIDLAKKNPNLKPLEKYQGADTNILHECLICGYKWSLRPQNALTGYGCPICAAKRNGDKIRKTDEQYKEELKMINPNLLPLAPYIDGKTSIPHLCLICNTVFNGNPQRLLGGANCTNCAKRSGALARTKTDEQYKEEVKQKNPNVKIRSRYSKATEPVETECLRCGYIWNPLADSILSGHGCPKCAIIDLADKQRKTTEQYVQELKELYPNIVAKEEYNGANVNIDHYCTFCDRFWSARPANVLQYGCPTCNGFYSGEKKVEDTFKKHDIIYIPQYRFSDLKGVGGKCLSYDFYLPDYNLLIEYQGGQHAFPVEYFGGKEKFKIQKEHDKRKREYADSHGYSFLEIWYYDYDNIEDIIVKHLNLLSLETAG